MKHCKHCNDILPENKRGLACNTCRNGLNRYGLTKLDQIKLCETQNNKCKLCDKIVELHTRQKNYSMTACIDHDHKTNKVRGVLCHACNISLGYLETKIGIDKLAEYLKLS